MADNHDDEALNRMRAADPARGSSPDQASLRRKLLDRTPLGHWAPGAAGDRFANSASDTAVRVNDGTTSGSRVTVVAAAAAAALAIAAGGYTVGAQTADDDEGGAGVAATDADRDAARDAAEERLDSAAAEDAATGEASGGDTGGAESASAAYYPYGPTVLEAGPDLSTEAGTGEVRVLRPADIDQSEFLTSWAEALDIEGEVQEMDGQYADFTSGAVYLSVTTGVSTDFNYSNMLADPYCAEMYGEDGGSLDESAPFTAEDCLPAGDVPDEEEAIAEAKDFLATTGIPLEGLEWSTQTYEGDPQVNVSGKWEDRPSNSFEVTVSAAGVSGAYGSLGEYESLGEYPVLSPAAAVERASDPRFAWSGVWIPRLDEGVELLEETELSQEPEPFDVAAGAPIPFPVNEATIVEATLDTGILSLNDGTEVLVPAYDLVDEDGLHHAVLALSDDALDFTP